MSTSELGKLGSDKSTSTSWRWLYNKPLEWTGRQDMSATHPRFPACHSGAALAAPCREQVEAVSSDSRVTLVDGQEVPG